MIQIIIILLGMLIGYELKKNTQIIVHGPDSNVIRNRIFKINNRKYRFKPYICICPIRLQSSSFK